MQRILFSIGPINIYSYGLMLALAFFVGIYLTQRRADKEGIDKNKILDLGFYLLLSGILGARLFFIVINWQDYKENPLDILKVWEGGLVFYGGFILAFTVALYYLKKEKISFLKMLDIIAPSLALGISIGRIGCFLNGCCYAKNPRLPIQLWESALALLIFFILLAIEKYKKFNGFLFWIFLFLYSLSRLMMEGLRDYPANYIFAGLTISQYISIILINLSLVCLVYSRKRQGS